MTEAPARALTVVTSKRRFWAVKVRLTEGGGGAELEGGEVGALIGAGALVGCSAGGRVATT